MIDELKFYIKHFFDFKISVNLKRYKRQNTIAFFLNAIVFIPLFIYFINYDFDLSLNDMMKLDEDEYIKRKMQNSLMYVVSAFFIFAYIQMTQISNEIHRCNARGVNWKKRIQIVVLIFIIFIGSNILLFINQQPEFMRTTMGLLILTPFIWYGNDQRMEGEKG
ncbi:hypothetical protein [Macrococcus sp. 18KM445]|uniref:hypothetical protein n=1 Tax=Macrococcus equi TaxID=3395462 RepID=UPI0039BE3E4D